MNKIVLLAALLLTATSSAQLEPLLEVAAPSISLSMDAEGTITSDAAASFMLTVSNTGTPTNTPLDQAVEIKLELESAPTSWVVEISPSIVNVMPGASASSTVTVSAPPGSAASGAVTIRGFANNGAGPINAEGEDTASIALTNADTATRSLLNTLGPLVWVLVGLLAITIVLVVVMWLQSNKKNLALSAQKQSIQGAPGAKLTIPISVKNLTREHVNVLFEVSSSAGHWAAFMLSPEMDLKGNASGEAQFVAIIPKEEAGGKTSYIITANSSAGPKQASKLKITVLVEKTPAN
jgi:uncharacterized membrane protein